MKWRTGNKMTYWENCSNLDGSRRVDDPPDRVKQKLDTVMDSVLHDKGCEVLDE